MITFFTTTKAFNGKNSVNQLNAIDSWLAADPNSEIVIFGNAKGSDLLPNTSRIKIIENIKTNENGVPVLNFMFSQVSMIAHNQWCCYINADILISSPLIDILKIIKQQEHKKVLIVGQRIDVDVNERLAFADGWVGTFEEKYKDSFKLHSPSGIDYFLFPKGQYTETNMPPMLVGRPGWDLWMIGNAVKSGYKAIDLSRSYKIYHQNHDYNHKNKNVHIRAFEDEYNYQFLNEDEKYNYTLYACNYKFEKGKVKKNYSRNNLTEWIKINATLHPEGSIKRKFYKLSWYINSIIRTKLKCVVF
ncbi:MAG: hypothetical protein RIQ89_1299 [Bacteroidota bacterium]|jgi:hypothetical protein